MTDAAATLRSHRQGLLQVPKRALAGRAEPLFPPGLPRLGEEHENQAARAVQYGTDVSTSSPEHVQNGTLVKTANSGLWT